MGRFIIFISITLLIYGGISFYLYTRAKGLVRGRAALNALRIILIAVSTTFFISRFLQSHLPLKIFEILLKIGSYWLGILIYTFLSLAAVDFIRLMLKITGKKPLILYRDPARTKQIIAAAILLMVCMIMGYGYHNARNPRISEVEIKIPGKGGVMKELNAVLISDIHLGDIIANRDLAGFVSKINELDPDIIFMAGDIIDNRIESLKIRKTGEIFMNLKSRFGIYAVTGNHEYFQDVKSAVAYLEGYGIKFLQDEAVLLGGGVYIAGRKDRSSERFGHGKRMPLWEITSGLNREYPVILLDHQPYDLHEAEEDSIDLQLSGHTHNGQFFPGNIVVWFMYEKVWGYHKRGNTQYYISSGIGTWGPAVRFGSVPEIVKMKIRFVGPADSAGTRRQ